MNAPPPATTLLTPRSELTIRLVATITLVPVVAGLAGIVTALVPSPPVRDQLFLYFVLFTVGGVGAGIVIWRSYVRWTRTRVAGTLLLKGLLLAHLIAWTPLWDAGCTSDELTASQCISLLGLAVPSAVLLWWGGLRLLRRGLTSVPSSARGRKLMSVTAVRILLALALRVRAEIT